MVRKWTSEDRVVLCILKRSYTRRDIAPLFNFLRNRSVRPGDRDSIRIEALETQWHNMKSGGKGHNILHKVESFSDTALEQKYRTTFGQIKSAAQTLKIRGKPLVNRPRTYTITSSKGPQHRSGRSRRRSTTADTMVTEVSTAVSEDQDSHLRPALRQYLYDQDQVLSPSQSTGVQSNLQDFRDQLSSRPVIPALRTNKDFNNETTQAHPILLFRATSTMQSFRTRKYVDPAKHIPAPPDFNSPEWGHISKPHLQRDKKYPSPFLSLAQNCKNALQRVVLASSEEIDKKIFLAIFDFNKVQQDAVSRFGLDSGPYLVRSMFPNGQLSDLPNGYRGSGEWLAYGSIDCDAIAVLDASSAVRLAKALLRLAHGDADAIADIKMSLRTVPERWRENVAYHFLRGYCANTPFAKIGSLSYESLIHQLYQEEHRLSTPPRSHTNTDTDWVITSRHLISGDTADNEEEIEERNRHDEVPQLVVRVPKTQQNSLDSRSLTTSKVINSLNIVATQTSAKDTTIPRPLVVVQSSTQFYDAPLYPQNLDSTVFDFCRTSSTPLWSEDSEAEDHWEVGETPTPAPRPSSTLDTVSEPSKSSEDDGESLGEDWDVIEADLERSLIEEFPLAAPKIRRFDESLKAKELLKPTQSEDIAQSIENGDAIHGFEIFSQELLASALAATPTPVPVPTTPAASNSKDQQRGHRLKIAKAVSRQRSRIGLTADRNESFLNNPLSVEDVIILTEDTENDEEDGFIIPGSGRRSCIRLPLRSLSIRDEDDIIYIE